MLLRTRVHVFCQTLRLRRGALCAEAFKPTTKDNAAPQTLLLSPAVVGPMTGAPARASASCLFPLTIARARSVDAQEAEGQRCWQGEHGRGGVRQLYHRPRVHAARDRCSTVPETATFSLLR